MINKRIRINISLNQNKLHTKKPRKAEISVVEGATAANIIDKSVIIIWKVI